jgi:GNAT superfamily N-acetyltransferase
MDIRRVDLSPEGLDRTADLLRKVFPVATHIDRGYLDRLYNGNPNGPTDGVAAWEGDQLVGHYLMIPITAVVHGETMKGIWPFQLAVDPGVQGKGIFRALFEASDDVMREGGYQFISGCTNANSAPIFQKAFGVHLVKPLDVKIGTGALPPSRPLDETQYARVWSPDEVSWRCDVPAEPYFAVEQDNRTEIWAKSDKPLTNVQVGDFPKGFVPDRIPRKRSGGAVRVWIGQDPTREWKGSLYRDLPEKLRASPMMLTFGHWEDKSLTLDPDKVQWSIFDFDAF